MAAIALDAAPGIALAAGTRTVIGAAVDIGANSVHLLVSAATGHRLEPLLDESAFLGLGDRVASAGYLGAAARDDLVAALAGYAAAARDLGAREITLVATEPLRRAADASAVVHEVESRIGLPLHVLDHREEGLLTLVGVTAGRPLTRETLIVDIGGGSSEIVIARPGAPVEAAGLPVGSARLTADHVRADPPTLEEIEAMSITVHAILERAPDASPKEVVAVGGTASNLLRLLPPTVVDQTLTSRRIAITLAMLTVEASAEAAARHALRPARARILPAGAVIVDALLERYGVDRARVSDDGIREGAILAATVAGNAWRDQLGTLAMGWET
jgi:exopolyphosphatase/guanosine-5'-triphosphate,3'-diphosphate pyrophosphatase